MTTQLNLKSVITEYLEEIKKIIQYEEDNIEYFEKNQFRMAWDYGDVGIDPRILYKLFVQGVLTLPFGTGGKTKNYALKDREHICSVLKDLDSIILEETEEKSHEISDDIFSLIIGYDDLKKVIKMSIESEQPVHILLNGPPASAKSLFLMDIERLEGAVFTLGGSVTKVGIREILFELPRYLIIDEFDKVNDPKEVSSLLTWMESGRVTVDKHNTHLSIQGKGWVFAAANRLYKIPPEIISRFMVFNLKEYSKEQFIEIVKNVLIKRENLEEELSTYIAEKISQQSNDVRDAIKIARLAKDKENVDFLLGVIDKYR